MIRQIDAKGDTIDAAINKALLTLGIADRDEVSVEIITQPRSGFLGIGKEPAVVRVTYQTSPAERAKNFLEGVLIRLNAPAVLTSTENYDEKLILIDISGDNMGAIIGRRGDTLDALQCLCSFVANRDEDEHWRITLDTENYRAKREEALKQLAQKTAAKALKYKRGVALETMKPYERRVIHAELQNYAGITTYSTGNEPNRKVIVAPEGEAKRPQNSGGNNRSRRGGQNRNRRPRSGNKPNGGAAPAEPS